MSETSSFYGDTRALTDDTSSFYGDTRTLTDETSNFYGDGRVQSEYPTRQELVDAIATLQAAIDAARQLEGDFTVYVGEKQTELTDTITRAQNNLNSTVSIATTSLNTQVQNAQTLLSNIVTSANNNLTARINAAQQQLDALIAEANGDLTEQINTAQDTLNTLISDAEADFNETLAEAAQIVQDLTNLRTEFRQIKQEVDAAVAQVAQAVSDANASAGIASDAATAAQAAQRGAEQAQTAAENAQRGAEQAQTAAETAAGNAATSAAATAAIKTELQEALTEASGVAGRVTLLETGRGAYKDPATGEMFYFEPLIESDGTIAVIKNNGVAWQIAPVEWAAKGGAYLSQCRAYSDGKYVYFFSASEATTYGDWLYVVYDKDLNRISPILILKDGYGLPGTHAGPFACFVTDDLVFCQNKYTTNKWTCFDKATGAKVADYSPGSPRLLVYNKKTANILAISLAGAVSVLSSARETVFTELATYDASGIFALENVTSGFCSFVNRAAYHTYFCVCNKLDGHAQTLYRVNDDDTISVVNASYGTTDADGKVAFEEGVTFDDYIVTKSPVTTENGLIPFNKSVSRTVDGTTKSAWASMPIMFSASDKNGVTFHIISNGLNFYYVLPDGRCVESYSIGNLWAWIRPDMWNGKPNALPALTIGTVEGDVFLPNRSYHSFEGSLANTELSQLVCKATLPSGTVFPLRDAGADPRSLPTLGDQKAVHAPAPLLASKIALALPMNSPWGIVGVPSHIIRRNFS